MIPSLAVTVRVVVPDPEPVDVIGQVVEKLPPVKIVAFAYLSWRFEEASY
jgi:hypothetical protein